MNRPIKTYSDLLQEEQRLQEVIRNHKLLIQADIAGIKDGLNPVKQVVKTFKQFTTRGRVNPLANVGINFGVDFLVKRLLLARAGWLTKVVVPYFTKNISSHLLNEEDRHRITGNVQKFFKKMVRKVKDTKEKIAEKMAHKK